MRTCFVCRNAEGGEFRTPRSERGIYCECDICGVYTMEAEAFHQLSTVHGPLGAWDLTPIQRAVLSHRIRTLSSPSKTTAEGMFCITTDLLDRVREVATLPSPATQALNLVRLVGDMVSASGTPIPQFPNDVSAIIGTLDRDGAVQLADELQDGGVLRFHGTAMWTRISHEEKAPLEEPTKISLSLEGWKQYEAERRGQLSGQDGFLAMKFGEPELEEFVRSVLKPTVEEAFDCRLHDMRDVERAGVIDNIMRIQIRDARFVIVELTHDNHGAYWEAGFAEGLRKPVIYICEEGKFERLKTHFDTNHCTTVTWTSDKPDRFKDRLVATLRRSLDEPE